MNESKRITHHIDNGLGIITFIDERNTINPEFIVDMKKILTDYISDNTIRAILLRHTGVAFCSGMDLISLQHAVMKNDTHEINKYITMFTTLLEQIRTAPKPIIACIDGPVLGGGMGLVSVCDIIYATEYATFCFSEVLFGVIPANIIPFIAPHRLSWTQLQYLTLTATTLSAHDAYTYNYVNQICNRNQMNTALKKLMKQLFRSAPHALQYTKNFISTYKEMHTISHKTEYARNTLTELVCMPAVQSGMKQLQSSELPHWAQRFKPTIPLYSEPTL